MGKETFQMRRRTIDAVNYYGINKNPLSLFTFTLFIIAALDVFAAYIWSEPQLVAPEYLKAVLLILGGVISSFRPTGDKLDPLKRWIKYILRFKSPDEEGRPSQKLMGNYSLSWSFSIALLFMMPLFEALIINAVMSVIGSMFLKRKFIKTVFNVSQLVIVLFVGEIILRLFRTTAFGVLSEINAASVIGILIAFVVMSLLSSVILHIGIALADKTPILGNFHSLDIFNLEVDLIQMAFAPIAVLTLDYSMFTYPFFLIVSLTAYKHFAIAEERRYEADHDSLTGLYNRRAFFRLFQAQLATASYQKTTIGIISLDLNGFKELNDVYGHGVGDEVLHTISNRLTINKRNEDVLARLGGDEFALVLPRIENVQNAFNVAQRLEKCISREIITEDGIKIQLMGSFGISLYPDFAQTKDILLKQADEAMYYAKKHSSICIYTPHIHRGPFTPSEIVDVVTTALQEGQFYLLYQPKINVADETLHGVEALVRWKHPVHGEISPDHFIPMIEQTEVIDRLTLWVLEEALKQASLWKQTGANIPIAINVSARNLRDETFPSKVHKLLEQYNVVWGVIEMEITENAITKDPLRTQHTLRLLREMGISFALDDFGTGYSSLTHLRTLDIDTIKIDKSFIDGITTSPKEAFIAKSVIELTKNLGIVSIAEGVENIHTLELLESYGCDLIQGFLFSRPIKGEEVLMWEQTRDPVTAQK